MARPLGSESRSVREDFARSAELDRVMHALSNPVRRYLLDLMRHDGATAGDLAASAAAMYGISTARASQHLRVLAEASLVDITPDATWRHYRYRPGSTDVVAQWLSELGTP